MTNSSSGETVLDRVLRILSAFDAQRRHVTVAELAQLTDIPLATTYRLVGQLAAEDILTRYPDGSIGLGMRLWELAARSSPAVSLRTAAMPFLDDVQSIFRQHAQLSVLDAHELLGRGTPVIAPVGGQPGHRGDPDAGAYGLHGSMDN